MKKRLNLLCILVIGILSFSVVQSLYLFGLGFSYGMKAVESSELNKEEHLNQLMNLQVVGFVPDGPTIFNDSVYNEKTQSYIPAFYTQMAVSIPTKPNIWQKTVSIIGSLAHLLTLLMAVVLFIRIIIAVNNSYIFNWKNVSRLRWLGGLLVLNFVCSLVAALVSYQIISGTFSLQGYKLHLYDFISILTLVLGVVAYIVAEIFAIGLHMQEEQELTI